MKTSSVAPTLPTLMNELSVLSHKWESISNALQIPRHRSDYIRVHQRTSSECLYSVLEYWLMSNTDIPVTWESVVEILDSYYIGERTLAEKLRKQYITTQAAKTGK